jgi:hypothetical protein
MPKIKISYFENVEDTTPKEYNLDKWLKATIDPPKELAKKVDKYRKLGGKRLKLQIPCVTISASFKKKRRLNSIKKKNALICLDIDSDANPVADMHRVKELLSSHPSTMYCGFSVSNGGIYAIIRLKDSKNLKKYFKHFKKSLRAIGIVIDESCKDYTRLRFFSVDKEAYYNPKAKPFKLPKKKRYHSTNTPTAGLNDERKVEAVIAVIEQNSLDITSNYHDWVKIAGALYNAFGENGREYFHRVSKFHHAYKQKATDRKFDSCRNMKSDSLSSFFYVADSHGVRY